MKLEEKNNILYLANGSYLEFISTKDKQNLNIDIDQLQMVVRFNKEYTNIKINKIDDGFLIAGCKLVCKNIEIKLYDKNNFLIYSSLNDLDVCDL